MRRQITRAYAALAAAALVTGLGYAGAGAAGAAVPGHGGGATGLLAAQATARAAAVPGARLWVSRYNGAGNGQDTGQAVAYSPGRVFTAGVSYSGSATGDDFTLVAHNSVTGARLWVKAYDAPGAGSARVSMAVSPDGTRVFMTGLNGTVAYDAATGARLWAVAADGSHSALAVARDGSKVFVTGSASGASTVDYATVAYSAATGARLWVSHYNGTQHGGGGDDYAAAIAVGGSRVFVTGASPGASAESDFTTVAYNAVTGTQLWVNRYHAPGTVWYDSASAVAVSPDQSQVFVTGTSFGVPMNADYATVAISAATGARLWVKRYNGPGNARDSGHAVTVAQNGSKVFVTGESAGGASTGTDYATVAYRNVDGKQLWVKRYHGSGSGFDSGNALVSPGNGKVYITGVSFGGTATSRDYATIAYRNFDGKQLWVKRYNGPGNRFDTAYSIVANADGGKVFVTGGSRGTSGQDYATIAYRG